jgi:hypothetical protein
MHQLIAHNRNLLRIKAFSVFVHTTAGMPFKHFNPFCITILRLCINA